MTGTDSDEMSEDEAYANYFFHFMRTLRILSNEAEQQSEELGHFNAAWEIKDDFLRWSDAVLRSCEKVISSDQEEQIFQIVAVLEDIPSSVLKSARSRPENIEALRYSCWNELRHLARQLIPSLQEEASRVDAILNLK